MEAPKLCCTGAVGHAVPVQGLLQQKRSAVGEPMESPGGEPWPQGASRLHITPAALGQPTTFLHTPSKSFPAKRGPDDATSHSSKDQAIQGTTPADGFGDVKRKGIAPKSC
ncbi:uncharacterized protein M6G45_011368 [Spheniscus humboldti]